MKLSRVLSSVLSAYTLKAVQFFISLAIIPFLLSDEVLGASGYGLMATIVSTVGLLGIFTDGFKISFIRSLSKNIDNNKETVSVIIGSGTKVLLTITIVVVFISILLSGIVLKLVNLPNTALIQKAYIIYLFCFFFDNSFTAFEGTLHTTGKTPVVNLIFGLESIIRNSLIYISFTYLSANLNTYFYLFLFGSIAKQILFFIIVYRNTDLNVMKVVTAPISNSIGTIKYSFSVTLNSVAFILLNRATIIVSNIYYGLDVAAYVAIILNTVYNYLNQLFYAAFRPILIPILTRLDLKRIKNTDRLFFENANSIYFSLIIFTAAIFVSIANFIVPFWLGESYQSLIRPFQIAVVGISIFLSANIMSSYITSQGYALDVSKYTSILSLVCSILIVVISIFNMHWYSIILIITCNRVACYFIIESKYISLFGFENMTYQFRKYAYIVSFISLCLLVSEKRAIQSVYDLSTALFITISIGIFLFFNVIMKYGEFVSFLYKARTSLSKELPFS
jgi:O-antigen/teichoic acid export membrane protein